MLTSTIGVPAAISRVLESRGFRLVEDSHAGSRGALKYENDCFAVQLHEERDGEVYMKVGPLGLQAESFFLPGVIAFLRSNDALTRETLDVARALDENYDGLVRLFELRPSGEIERKRLQQWIADFAQREVERLRLAAEKVRTPGRAWWKLW